VKDSAKSTPRTSTPVAPVRNEKKALKKARAREKKAANDELDKALAELSIQYVFVMYNAFKLTVIQVPCFAEDLAS